MTTTDNWVREAIVAGALWQWVATARDDGRSIFMLTGYRVDGNWTYLPATTIETRKDETQRERFDEFVDTFLGHAKENG